VTEEWPAQVVWEETALLQAVVQPRLHSHRGAGRNGPHVKKGASVSVLGAGAAGTHRD
jgi:hypothetical protein